MGRDIGGVAVHVVARIMALAGPSEVFASAVTVGLADGSGLAFEGRGQREVRGSNARSRSIASPSSPSGMSSGRGPSRIPRREVLVGEEGLPTPIQLLRGSACRRHKGLAARSRCVYVTLWVVKGGRGGIKEERFRARSVIGIGWGEVGDFDAVPGS